MRFKFSTAILSVALLGLAGCATMPATYTVSNSRTYNQEYDAVWEKIVQFFASRNIPIKNIAKDSGVIYAENTSFDASYADCGTGGLMVPFAHRASINVFVTRSGEKPTVSVNTQFEEMRRFDANTQTVRCNSKGVIEQAVLDAIGS